jgi:hypothetical protein
MFLITPMSASDSVTKLTISVSCDHLDILSIQSQGNNRETLMKKVSYKTSF